MRIEFQATDGSRVRVLNLSIHDPRRNNPRYFVIEEGLLGETTTPDQPGFDRTHSSKEAVAVALAKAVARDSATSALLVAHRDTAEEDEVVDRTVFSPGTWPVLTVVDTD
ncbi:MAG: hypothetical protein M9891_13505 [Austwickia sp.]|nr:hypothetical protein [Actinomycetota bacterium]MCB1254650.1 hypothetical protein [Austwickia sp.]MCO5310272.1 hypothetical protein [Austwickia sp.]